MMLMSIEWHLLSAFVAVLGLAFPPLLWVAVVMFLHARRAGVHRRVRRRRGREHTPLAEHAR